MTTSGASEGQGSGRAAPTRGICTFWLGDQHLGLDVAIVNEVVVVHDVTLVPKAPPAVRGLFNLRGTAVPLVELRDVLGLGALSSDRRDETTTALVLRHGELLVGFPIDRMEAVVLAGHGTFTESAGTEHPAVHGFLELAGEQRTVTLLDSSALLARLEAVRFVAEGA